MKSILANLGANLVSLTAVIGALYLLAHDKQGWGWFVFLAFCCSYSVIVGGKSK